MCFLPGQLIKDPALRRDCWDVITIEQNGPSRDNGKGKKIKIKVRRRAEPGSLRKQQKRELSEVRAATSNQVSTISKN